jgi:hypothetical protein
MRSPGRLSISAPAGVDFRGPPIGVTGVPDRLWMSVRAITHLGCVQSRFMQ